MLGRFGKLGNFVLMGLLPIALTAPLAVSEVDFWFYSVREEISIAGSLIALHKSGDMLLFYTILCLSVIGPYLRLILMTYAAFSSAEMAVRIRPLLELVGRFSLIDVIIISLLVISFRVPEFKLQWGFYLVLWLWVLDMLASWAIWTRLSRDAERARLAREDVLEMEPAPPPRKAPPRRKPSGQEEVETQIDLPASQRRQRGRQAPAPTEPIGAATAASSRKGRKAAPKNAPPEIAEERKNSAGPAEPPQIAGVENIDGGSGRAAALAGRLTDRILSAVAAAPRASEPPREASLRPGRSSESD